MKLTLCFSPCPNDTFIFDAMVNGKIDTEGLSFEVQLEDVETLNRLVLSGQPDISKISYGLLPKVLPDYRVLDAGSALGRGVGPLLVAMQDIPATDPELEKASIVLPGMHTTAHMLFTLSYPLAKHKIFMPFHEIEAAVINGVADAGVIIHENRFTYAQKGLTKLADLGEIWEQNTGQPIPLGGIVMRREIDPAIMQATNRVIRRSLDYAFERYPNLPAYVKEHALEMEESVMRQHIDLYVNDFSRSLGSAGREAVWKMLDISSSLHPEPVTGTFEIFI
jgi:1,4-dihydroxy-6-naphthoate synthase